MKYLRDLMNLFLPSKIADERTDMMFVIRDRRIIARYLCLILTCGGIYGAIKLLWPFTFTTHQIVIISIMIGIPGVIFLLISDLTVTADKTREILTIHYRSILLNRRKVFSFSDIWTVHVQSKPCRDGDTHLSKYRLAVDTKSGTKLFRHDWSYDDDSKKCIIATDLNKFIGSIKHRHNKAD